MSQGSPSLLVLSVVISITVCGFVSSSMMKGVDRWKIAKGRKLCFRCLASNYRGKTVQRATYVESMVVLEIITAFFLEVKCWQKLDR